MMPDLHLKHSEMMLFKPASSHEWEQWLTPVQKQLFDELCQWIDAHLVETIGWQQLMKQSGLQYQTIQSLFHKYQSVTTMTWIRRRREGGLSRNNRFGSTTFLGSAVRS